MKTRGLIVFLLVILLAASASAFSEVIIEPINDRIELGEKAVFSVSITNERSERQKYTLVSPSSGSEWSVDTRPLSDSIFSLNAGQTKTIEVVVEPLEDFEPSVYVLTLSIDTNFGEKYRKNLKVYIGPGTPKEYLPSLRVTVDMNDNIDPREAQSIKLFIENLNPLDLRGTTVKITSDMPEFNIEQVVDLEPNEKKTVEFSVEPNPFQQPKSYILFFVLEKGNQTLKVVEKQVEIVPLVLEFTQEMSEDRSFLKNVQEITFVNDGNVKNTQTMKVAIGALERLFTSSEPEGRVVKENGKRHVTWEVELGPNEQAAVTVKTSYRVPFVVLIVILIVLLLYQIYKNPVAASKSASNVELKEGGVAGMKVTLLIKNLSTKPIKDIEIIEEIPSIVDVEKDVEMGTLKPSRFLRGRQGGVFVQWKLSELEGKEERLISYRIKSKLNILGTFKLPRAKVKFVSPSGKKKVSYSNAYSVSLGEE